MADYTRPSLASATSTRIDSGCKHIQQCRVSQDHMVKFARTGNHSGDDLLNNKYGYAVHKDEPVLALRECWYDRDKTYGQNAYPRVVSNLGRMADKESGGDLPEAMKFMLWMYHTVGNLADKSRFIRAANTKTVAGFDAALGAMGTGAPYFKIDAGAAKYIFQDQLELIHDFTMVGYANTVGFAHAHHGDTMTSVHIGGLRTVMNGDFPVRCGEKLQWYWPDEFAYFDKDGVRHAIPPATVVGGARQLANPLLGVAAVVPSTGAREREGLYNLQYGQTKNMQKYVPRVKPFVEDETHPRLYDHLRIFAVAISSARPHEMFDIMIGRQAI